MCASEFHRDRIGDRDVFVSDISEVPIWKSTYRILFSDKPGDKPLLQGWAIVDNTIGEDWKEVQLSLVAGAPQSFIQDISQPFYARRPVVPLPESVMLTPQSHQATLEGDQLQQSARSRRRDGSGLWAWFGRRSRRRCVSGRQRPDGVIWPGKRSIGRGRFWRTCDGSQRRDWGIAGCHHGRLKAVTASPTFSQATPRCL